MTAYERPSDHPSDVRSAASVRDEVADGFQGLTSGTGGKRDELRTGSIGERSDGLARVFERHRLTQQSQRLGVLDVVGHRSARQDFTQAYRIGVAVVTRECIEDRQRRYALAEISAGRLAGLRRLG